MQEFSLQFSNKLTQPLHDHLRDRPLCKECPELHGHNYTIFLPNSGSLLLPIYLSSTLTRFMSGSNKKLYVLMPSIGNGNLTKKRDHFCLTSLSSIIKHNNFIHTFTYVYRQAYINTYTEISDELCFEFHLSIHYHHHKRKHIFSQTLQVLFMYMLMYTCKMITLIFLLGKGKYSQSDLHTEGTY